MSYNPQVPQMLYRSRIDFITFEAPNPRQISPRDLTPPRPPEKSPSGSFWGTG